MTDHYDEIAVAPDPAQAEALRQRLHARGTATGDDARRYRGASQVDRGADRDRIVVSELAPSATSITRHDRRGRYLMVAAAVVVVAIATGVALRAGDRAPVDTTAPPVTDGGSSDPCPLTAGEVSTVLGVTVRGPESSTECHFSTGPSIIPSAGFSYLPASACTPENLQAEGFVDGLSAIGPVEGLPVDAHAQRSGVGVRVIVCDGERPFELHVEVVGDAQAAALSLAALVLHD